MSRSRKRGGLRPNKRFFILLGVIVLAIGGYFAYDLLVDTSTAPRRGDMSFEAAGEAIVIRDETLFQTENYGKTVFFAYEGEHVSAGDTIAEAYKWGFTDRMATELLTLQQTIMDYQRGNLIRDTLSEQLAEHDAAILEKSRAIAAVVEGSEDGDVLTLERELSQLMADRNEFLHEYQVGEDDQLESYYQQEEDLQLRIDKLKNTITAEEDGIVSFYFDGAETIINTDKMTEFTISDIDNVFQGKTYTSISDSSAQRPLYRLVKPNEWYIMLVTDIRYDEFQVGTTFTVSPGQQSQGYNATVTDARTTGGKYLYYFKITEDIGDLISARALDITIKKTFSGMILPEAAVVDKDGTTGVYTKVGGQKIFVPVTVRIAQNGEALVEPVSADTVLDETTVVVY